MLSELMKQPGGGGSSADDGVRVVLTVEEYHVRLSSSRASARTRAHDNGGPSAPRGGVIVGSDFHERREEGRRAKVAAGSWCRRPATGSHEYRNTRRS